MADNSSAMTSSHAHGARAGTKTAHALSPQTRPTENDRSSIYFDEGVNGGYPLSPWVEGMCVYSVPHTSLIEPVIYITHIDYERDENNRKVRIVYEHAVADLPPITDGGSIRQKK